MPKVIFFILENRDMHDVIRIPKKHRLFYKDKSKLTLCICTVTETGMTQFQMLIFNRQAFPVEMTSLMSPSQHRDTQIISCLFIEKSYLSITSDHHDRKFKTRM